ncbi:MAG: hypothetical protein E6H00_04805 [Bacillati bacterium ANGP1]|uniref:Uncharacterized protein n=1 Tax=Candidatus Segetimicrobium genomatis TaxID=2569760 RepID=A0A537K659_9BACT|nr:MAG: hypothetical protein E6H00_04805 [Terrabacteria group bacterium ANGP1]
MPKPRSQKLFDWRAAAIYIAAVAVAGAGLFAWDHAYQARLSGPRLRPEALAKRLVESFVGDGTVQGSTLDRSGTLTIRVKDVVTDKSKTPAQNRELVSREGSQAVERVLGLVAFKQIVVQVVRDGKVLATVRGKPGAKPETDFAPEFK